MDEITKYIYLIIGILCFVLYRFLKRLDSPYLELAMEDKFISLPRMKKIICGGLFAYGSYKAIS